MNSWSFTKSKSLSILIVSSVLFCYCNKSVVAEDDSGLTWTKSAAEEAEWAAAQDCSGHGFLFTDTFPGINQIISTSPVCECNKCFLGNNCPFKNHNCIADAYSGDPTFMEPFWLRKAEESVTVVPGWYRLSYRFNDDVDSLISPQLESLIRKLHALVGNAVTENTYFVGGVGSMQLIDAAVHSLAYSSSSGYQNRALVVSPAPFYNAYQTQTEIFESIRYVWAGDSRQWANKALNSTTKYIEIVASPNNPDGVLQKGVLDGNLKNVKKVFDRAYYWPHYSPITEAANEDVMLFSLSKLTGHAGSRFGWAIVKDRSVYERMKHYVVQNVIKLSHDTQLRATNLLKMVIKSYQDPTCNDRDDDDEKIFDYGYSVMSSRWQKIQKAFQGSQRFSLKNHSSSYCNFFKRVRDPSPAYAWVKCLKDADCGGVFRREGGITGRNGSVLGVDGSYVRLSLIKRKDAFDNLHNRLITFLS